MDTPKVKKESKNKIRVDFERAPLLERLKTKFLSMFFLKKVVYMIFKIVLLVGVSYVILYPYIAKIFGSFMTKSDFEDATVILISKNPTFDQYKYIILDNQYFLAFLNSFLVSFTVAVVQTMICALIGYGLAKFKFKGNNIVFLFVVLTMMVPQSAIKYSLQLFLRYFGENHIIGKILYGIGIMKGAQLGENSFLPLYVLSFTGLGFKNGLFIFMLRQFFRGVPDELEESAYVDGSNTFRTFFSIILPLAVPMLITVFVFSFAWQWTDNFYYNLFFDAIYRSSEDAVPFITNIYQIPQSLKTDIANLPVYAAAIQGTGSILIVIPLVIGYLFLQNKIVQGIERSGIVG